MNGILRETFLEKFSDQFEDKWPESSERFGTINDEVVDMHKLVTMPDEETEDPYEDFRKEPRPVIQETAEASGSAADLAEVELEEPAEPKPAPAPATTNQPTMKPTTKQVVITEEPEQTTLPEIAKGGIFDGHSGATTQPEKEILAIPIWVWILVAIIGVIVILCIILVMTRYLAIYD